MVEETIEEKKEKLVIKYLGMSYSFDIANQLADEELELLAEEEKKKAQAAAWRKKKER